MPATVAGEAAVRIVPSVRGFHGEVKRKLEQKRVDFDVNINANMKGAYAHAEAFRKAQEARPVTIRVQTDWNGLKRDLAQVEHIFKRNSFSRALRMNIVIAGLDLLPVLSYAAAGAAASLTTLARAGFALPGAFGGAAAAISTLTVGLHGVKDAFSAFGQSQKQTAENARIIVDDNRQLQRSYRDYGNAVRDTIRDIQDLNAENRRSSLNVADAILSVQEAADRLRQGGQKTILELRRDQLSYLQAVDRLQEVNTKAKRVAEDTAEANAKGVAGADKVADALDQINKNIEKLNTDKLNKLDQAMAKLSPNAQAFVTAVRGMKGEWTSFQNSVQDKLFAGLDQTIVQLGNNTLPMLERGMGRVATSLNASFKNIANELGSRNSTTLMERIFGNTDVGLQRLSVGIRPFIDGMLKLTKESSDFLPRLGEAGAKVAQRFNNWIYAISADGRLDKWISKGLDGFTSLGRTVGNIGSALNSLTQAFDGAQGKSGGFLKTLETQSKRLADYLKSPKGQNDLNSYFKETRNFVKTLKEAYVDIKPLIKDVVEAARDWSIILFKSIGYVASFTEVLDKHFGVLKPLLGLYFLQRTVKPVWELLAGSFKAYTTLIEAAGNNSTLGKWKFFDWQMQKLNQLRGNATQTAQAVANAASGAASPSISTQIKNGLTGNTTPPSTPVLPVNAAAVQAQAAARGVGAYSNPGVLYQYLASGAKSTPGVTKPTYAPSELYGPMAPAPQFPPNNQLSKKQREAKAAALAEYRQKASQFYDYEGKASLRGATTPAPAIGAMQGPQLPPEVFQNLDDRAKAAAKSVGEVGAVSVDTGGKVSDLGKKADATAASVDDTGKKSKKSKGDVEDLGKKAAKAAKGKDALSSSATKAATAAGNLGTAASNASPGVKSVGDAAKAAGGEIGTGNVGLMGRLAGLAGVLGPAAALTAGVAAVTWVINKMGESHRNAAAAAKEQDDALRQLAGTLDQVTGGFTRQTLAETAKQASAFKDQSGLFPTVDINAIVQRLGFDPTMLYTNASDPSKFQNYQTDIAGIDNLIEQQVRNAPEYVNNKAKFDAYNLDSKTLAKALRGDPTAVAAVRSAESNRKYVTGPGGKSTPIVTPNLGALANSLPNTDAFFAGRFLNDRQAFLATQGNMLASAANATGRATLKQAGSDLFSKYGPDQMMVIDAATGNGIVQLRQLPDPETIAAWRELQIDVRDNGPGAMATVTIDSAEASKYLQRYATGGLVRGPGGPTSDSILARVSAGEHITNAAAVSYYGAELFHALNDRKVPRYAPGGWPFDFPLAPIPSPDPSGSGMGGGKNAPVGPPIQPVTPPPATPPIKPPTPATPPVTPPAATTSTPAPATPAAPAAASPFLSGGTTAMPAMTPFLPGTPLPPARAGDETGLQVNAIGMKRTIETLFPAIQTIGGWREDPVPDHPSGAAIDVMVPSWDTPQGKAYGDSIAAWLKANGAAMGVKSFIWQDTWYPITEQGEPHRLNRTGANEGHYNHLHILTNGGGKPKGNEQYRMPQMAGIPAGMNAGLAQVLSGVFPGGLSALLQMTNGMYPGGVTPDMLTSGNAGSGSQSDMMNFLGGQANNIGSNILSIGANFLTGITGIDFNWLAGLAQTAGNAGMQIAQNAMNQNGQTSSGGSGSNSFLDGMMPGLSGLLGGGGGGSSPGAGVVGAMNDAFVNGQLPLDSPNVQQAMTDTGFNQNLDGSSGSSGSGEVTDADLGAAFDQLSGPLKLKNKSAWVSALSKNMNGSKSVFGAASGTPAQVALSALATAVRMWGIDSNGAPKTPSYAMGGGTNNGLAWLSNGEFRTNPRATRHYGSGLFDALNAKAIPRNVARGMLKGGIPGYNTGTPANPNDPNHESVLSQLLFNLGKNNLTAEDRKKMTPGVQSLKEQVAQRFNSSIGDLNGWRPPDITPYGNFTEHSSGQALDVWLGGPTRQSDGQMLPPADPTIGNRVRDFMLGRGADYVLWNQQQWNPDGTSSMMPARDGTPTMKHTNHDHARVKPGTQITPQPSVPNSFGQLLIPQGFAAGGWPLIPDPLLNPPAAQGQTPGPLPLAPTQPPAPAPMADAPAIAPDIGAQPAEMPVPTTGGEPGPGATAPAPDPGSLPSVNDALAGMASAVGGVGGGGIAQPGAAPSDQADPRGTLGAAPESQNHTNPALSGLISGIASTAGSAAAMAANIGMMGAGGIGAMGGGMGGASVGAGIQAGAQMAGAVVNGAVNILSSLLVGTATNGSTANASGVPLLPQRQPMQTGVPAMGQQYQDNRTYNITNLDEYSRLQERDAAQQTSPFIGKF